MSSNYDLTDEDVNDIINATAAAHFDFQLKNREAYYSQRPALSPPLEEYIRTILQDNAQYIAPVQWSDNSTIGIPLPSEWNYEEAFRVGLQVIFDAGAQEVQQYGFKPEYWPPPWHAIDSYLHSAVRATALQQNGFLRQGYLAVCTKGISLVGISLNWSPELELQQNPKPHGFFTGAQHFKRWHIRQLPPADAPYQFVEIAYIPYENIQAIKPLELLRIDGLSAFVAAIDNTYGQLHQILNTYHTEHKAYAKSIDDRKEKLYKDWKKQPRKTRTDTLPEYQYLVERPFRPVGLEVSVQFPEVAANSFMDTVDNIVNFGFSQASGVPREEEYDSAALQLFSKSLAATIVDSRNGTSLVVESVFSELDVALALIEDLRSTPPPQSSTNSTKTVATAEVPQFDIAAQLQKLADLHAAGALTEEEFREAKMKLLS